MLVNMEAIVVVIVVILILILAALIILTTLSTRRSKSRRNGQYRIDSVSSRNYRIEAPEPEEEDVVRPITTVFSQILEQKARPGSDYLSAEQLETEFPIHVKPVEDTIKEWVQRLRQRNGVAQTGAPFTAASASTAQAATATKVTEESFAPGHNEAAVVQEIMEAIEAGFDEYNPNAEHILKEIVEAIEAGFDEYDPNSDSVMQDIIGAIEDGFDGYDASTVATVKGIVEAIEAGFKR